MSQSIRQQIAQKQAELAELERQANLLEKVEVFQSYRDIEKANPTFHQIVCLRNYIVEKTLNLRPKYPEYIEGDKFNVLKIYGDKVLNECLDRDCAFRPELITEPFDLLIATETDAEAKDILEKSKDKCLKEYTEFVEKQNAPATKTKKGKN